MLRSLSPKFISFCALLLLTAGCGLIVFDLSADWLGLSPPGFSPVQTQLLIIGVEFCLISIGIFAYRERVNPPLVFQQLRTFAIQIKTDLVIAAFMFCVALAVGTMYVSSIPSDQLKYFYKPTIEFAPVAPWVSGVVYGISAAAAFAVFRLGVGRIFSMICTFGLIISPNQLHNLIPSLWRDYAKAPVVFVLLFLLGLLLVIEPTRSRIIGLSAATGIVLGIGILIRQDFIAYLPIVFLVLTLFLPRSAGVKLRAAGVTTFAFTLCLLAVPGAFSGKLRPGPVSALAGFMSPFDGRLGVAAADYDWGYLFSDHFIQGNTYAQTQFARPGYEYSLDQSDSQELANSHLFRIATNFPADVLTRGYGALLRILELPFTYLLAPIGITASAVVRFYAIRAELLGLMAGWGVFFLIAALAMISSRNLWLSVACLILIICLGAYPIFQFSGRHYFHLELITWWTLGFAMEKCLISVRFLWRRSHNRPQSELAPIFPQLFITARRVLAFCAVGGVIVFFPLLLFRHYQAAHVDGLMLKYADAEVDALPLVKKTAANGSIELTSPELFNKASEGHPWMAEYLSFDLGGKSCKRSSVGLVLRYETSSTNLENLKGRWLDFSRSLDVPVNRFDDSPTKVFFPAISYRFDGSEYFRGQGTTFLKGVEIDPEEVDCFRGFFKVRDPSKFPVVLTVKLFEAGNRERRHQRLAGIEASRTHTAPEDLGEAAVTTLFKRPRVAVLANDILYQAGILRMAGDRWVVNGYAQPQPDVLFAADDDQGSSRVGAILHGDRNIAQVNTELLVTKPAWHRRGDFFVARGVLHVGGATFGLLRNGRSVGSVDLTSSGSFDIALAVPDDGLYSLGLANNLDIYTSLENRFVISSAGWAAAAAGNAAILPGNVYER